MPIGYWVFDDSTHFFIDQLALNERLNFPRIFPSTDFKLVQPRSQEN